MKQNTHTHTHTQNSVNVEGPRATQRERRVQRRQMGTKSNERNGKRPRVADHLLSLLFASAFIMIGPSSQLSSSSSSSSSLPSCHPPRPFLCASCCASSVASSAPSSLVGPSVAAPPRLVAPHRPMAKRPPPVGARRPAAPVAYAMHGGQARGFTFW